MAQMIFPRIYRIITDKFNKLKQSLRFGDLKKKNSKVIAKFKFQSIVTLYLVTIALILFLSFDLLRALQKQKEINFERVKIQSEIKLWEEIAQKYQGYKEAYFQLAVLEYKLGDFDKAKYYTDRALYLDPNFEKARNLQNILKGY